MATDQATKPKPTENEIRDSIREELGAITPNRLEELRRGLLRRITKAKSEEQ